TKRQLAQRARQQAQIERQAAAAAAADPQAPLDNRTAAQRLRREREREDRERREREERDRLEPRPAPARQRQRQRALPPARRPYQEPPARHDLGCMDIKCSHCGALHWMAEKTANSSQVNPQFGMCCNHGKVVLAALKDLPPDLETLFVDDTAQAKEFRKNMAQYNTALSFTSLGDHSINNGGGPPIFRIHGELCHLAGALLPSPGQRPAYAQLYIYEPRAALEHRMQSNSNLQRDTMEILQRVIRETHQYAPLFFHSHEVLANSADDVSVRLRVAPGAHARRGNLPTVDEVAVILPNQQTMEPRDIIVRRRNGPLIRISDLHPAYTPLYYVLLFPHGENGWHPDLTL
ncbi:hypothetical protein B0H10DRAFT_1635821, partial [Mycena sp. CBHHK59/15]